MTKQPGILIGRFQPLHEGHISTIKQARSRSSDLLILIGSANACRSIKNPFTFVERRSMIRKMLHAHSIRDVEILPLNDYPYNDSRWIADVRETIEYVYGKNPTVTLYGHYKEGNDYLRWFPEYRFQDLEATTHLTATQIREKMFEENSPELPKTVRDDWAYYKKEKELFASYPFPETLNFNCADAIVECQGNVLLIKRLRTPGAGAWALPGGFRNVSDKTMLDTAIRELYEETSLKVPEKVIRGSIISTKLFDSNTRSFGIIRNTLAVYIRIGPDPNSKLPKISPADDAGECEWVPLNQALNYLQLYDDHAHIISEMTRVTPMPACLAYDMFPLKFSQP